MSSAGAPTWKVLPLAAMVLISGASLYFATRLGGPFLSHAESLWKHAWSGENWEVVPLDAPLKAYVAAIYRRPDIQVHFVAGTSFAFPFDTRSRRATVQYVGHRVPTEDSRLSFRDTDLQSAYRDYLYDKLLAASTQSGDPDWSRLLQNLQTELTSLSLGRRTELRRKTRDLARTVKVDSPLANALSNFDVGNLFLRSDILPLETYTEPAYDRIEDHREAVVKPLTEPESVCLADVREIGGKTENRTARVSLHSQFVELRIVRPWLDEGILDQHAGLSSEQKLKFFGEGGSLKAIPTSIVLEVGDELQISPLGTKDADEIRSLTRRNACCEVTCNGVDLILKPDSVNSAGELQFKGLVDRPAPVVLAIVSKRRSP